MADANDTRTAAEIEAEEKAAADAKAKAEADAKATRSRGSRAASDEPPARKHPHDEAPEGGRFMVEGQLVDANGNKVKG